MTTRRHLIAALVALSSCLLLLGLSPTQDRAKSRFAGQTVVITGANRGLGLELARQFSQAGAKVIGTARDVDGATDLKATGARVLKLDVSDEASVKAFAQALQQAPVHLLFNNAGISGRAADENTSRAELTRQIFEVNTLGPIRMVEALLPNLQAAGNPIVVNMSSRLGSLSDNTTGGYPGYRESKAALNMYTRSLAAEQNENGMIAICVSPGWVRTDMGGPDAPLEPEKSVRGLCSVIENLTMAQTGSFIGYDGNELNW